MIDSSINFDELERRNRPLNAFLNWDRAAAFGPGPLAGMTVGVKANIMVRGMPWHAGLSGFRSRIAERDAETVKKLRETGAAILGTLNMEEGALGSKTDNPHFGPTQNPHRAGYSPGGSSGGSGAAVAAGLCDAALGTDTLGSVRIPASHCGVYGFKPATDRIGQDGLEPADLSLDAIGPLARDLDTLERVARTVSRFGEEDRSGSGATLVDHGVEVHAEVAATFDRALGALDQPYDHRLEDKLSRIRFAGFIQVSRTVAQHLNGMPASDRLAKLLFYGPARSNSDWAADQAVLARTREMVRDIVNGCGYLVLPTVPNPPFPHRQQEPAAQADFTCLANIAGLPAISIPAGWTSDALPIGIQIIGKPGAEAGLFALARRLDDRLSAYRAPN